MKTGKNRHRLHMAAALLTALVILVSGCGLFKPTFESLVANMAKELGKVNSAAVTTKVDTEFEVGLEEAGLSVSGKLDLEADSEMTKEPVRSRQDFDLTVEAMGQTMSSKFEQYTEQTQDKKQIVYMREEGGQWTKTVVDPSGSGQENTGADSTGETSGEEKSGKEAGSGTPAGIFGENASVLEMIAAADKLKENLKDAELKKDLVTINDQEAYQTSFVMNEKLIFELARMGGTDLSKFGLNGDVSDEDAAEIPAELYIYKESGLPARITADCTALGDKLVSGKVKDRLQGTMFEGLSFKFRSFRIDMTFDRYNQIEAIEIPQEAIDAKETEAVQDMPDSLFDALGNF